MSVELIDKVKTRGYWRVNFRPRVFAEKLSSMDACADMVRRQSVALRGWHYPVFLEGELDHGGTIRCGEYLQGWADWWSFLEVWRLFKSGQFLHYFALRDDWMERDGWASAEQKATPPGTRLSAISTIYQVTEMMEFLRRLTAAGLYDEGVAVELALHNLKGRELWMDDAMRIPFFQRHVTGAEELKWSYTLSKDEAIGGSSRLVVGVLLTLFDAFGWEPSEGTLRDEHARALGGRV